MRRRRCTIFQPTPPVGAETRRGRHREAQGPISTHSARGGGDPQGFEWRRRGDSFQPTPPVGAETKGQRHGKRGLLISTHSARGGGDPETRAEKALPPINFNPLRPWGRRLQERGGDTLTLRISTHSARGGGDLSSMAPPHSSSRFQPTPPVGAETLQFLSYRFFHRFQPTPPVGAETNPQHTVHRFLLISTHSARGGGDGCRTSKPTASPRFQPTPPVGAETRCIDKGCALLVFQPTPPVGAETVPAHPLVDRHRISTHSARGGGDGAGTRGYIWRTDFNPLRPWGRRLTMLTSRPPSR